MTYLYTPFDIAVYFNSSNMTISEENLILSLLWEQKYTLISYDCRKERRHFFNLVKYEMHNMNVSLDGIDELNFILKEMGSKFSIGEQNYEQGAIESYFKLFKLKLTYTQGTDFCKIKLRTLIRKFGYKRRTNNLVECINRTIELLGLETYLRGWEPCDIKNVVLDDTIIIRLK